MAKATYRGPGDAVELDGLRVEAGKTYELTNEQVVRIRVSDPYAIVDVDDASESPLDVVRIRAAQDKFREDATAERAKDERELVAAQDRAERDAADRARKSADARQKADETAARERAEARMETARSGAPARSPRKEA